jgi:hypothetical protein
VSDQVEQAERLKASEETVLNNLPEGARCGRVREATISP